MAERVKSTWADAGKTEKASNKPQINAPVRPVQSFNLDSHPWEFNMNRFGFKYLRFLGLQKSCPAVPSGFAKLQKPRLECSRTGRDPF